MKAASRSKTFAKKSLGQNFLAAPNYVDKIIAAVSPSDGDTIIEIGPGRGALTEHLVESGANVIAIELDRDLVPVLTEKFSRYANFQVLEQDALDVNFETLTTNNSKLVANLPYYISTAILQHLAEQRHCFSELVLMFQREVVDRITAKPGNSDRGFLTVLVEASFETEKLFDVPPEAFRPMPKVSSSVVRLKPKPAELADPEVFRNMVSLSFAQKRKTILNNLKPHYANAPQALAAAGIEPSRRAETLTLVEWKQLAEYLTN
ncbi:MAG: 16S rRNA (adenine(1518)-N(6)/adenine(1519)-N(6))-dimethyltransferase RsmA [Pyrinomonadaceae bacterium]